jgi:hypothetical protein
VPGGLESDAEVQVAGGCVAGFEADLDALRSGPGEEIDAAGQDMSSESSLLVIVLGPHGFHDPDSGLGVAPEQPVCRDVVVAVVHDQIEVRAVQRRLT